VTSSTTRSQSTDNKMPSGRQVSRYPYRMSPLIVAVIFVPARSIARICLQVHAIRKFLSHDVLSEAPAISRKSHV